MGTQFRCIGTNEADGTSIEIASIRSQKGGVVSKHLKRADVGEKKNRRYFRFKPFF